MSQFTALVVPAEPNARPYWHDFTDYKEIQAKVGGTFEVFEARVRVPTEHDEFQTVSVYVDGDGLYTQTVPNLLGTSLRGYRIMGDIVVAGDVDPFGEQLDLPGDVGRYIIAASSAGRTQPTV